MNKKREEFQSKKHITYSYAIGVLLLKESLLSIPISLYISLSYLCLRMTHLSSYYPQYIKHSYDFKIY